MILQFGAIFSAGASTLLQEGLKIGSGFLENQLNKKRRKKERRRGRGQREDPGVQAGERVSRTKPPPPVQVAAAQIVPQAASFLPQVVRAIPPVVRAAGGIFGAQKAGEAGEIVGAGIGDALFGRPAGPVFGQQIQPASFQGGTVPNGTGQGSSEKFALNPFTGTIQSFLGLANQGIVPKPPFFRIKIGADGRGRFVKIKRRRTNPLNFKALMRANRRVESFENIIKKNFSFSRPAKGKSEKRIVRRRKKRA